MNTQLRKLAKAFPSHIKSQVNFVLINIDSSSRIDPTDSFSVIVGDDTLEIPYRIYYAENNLSQVQRFTPLQDEILNCLYTRHHNGYIRERCLKRVISSTNTWVVPYVVQLMGEYVIEILEVINQHLHVMNHRAYQDFLLTNSDFYEITKHRVVSYWDCYYKWKYPERKDYVGFQLIEFFDALLKNE